MAYIPMPPSTACCFGLGPGRRNAMSPSVAFSNARWFFAALIFLLLPPSAQTQPPSGAALSWGDPVLPYVPPGVRFRAIAAGRYFSAALDNDGTVVAWGRNSERQSTPPAG